LIQRPIPPVDLRLEAFTLGVTTRIVLFIRDTPWPELSDRLTAISYNHARLIELSGRVYQHLQRLVAKLQPFGFDAFDDPELRTDLGDLNTLLYGMSFPAVGKTLAEVIEAVSAHHPGRPTLAVNSDLGLVPWEVTSPDLKIERRRMLAHRLNICGMLSGLDEAPSESLYAPRPFTWGRAPLTYGDTLNIYAAGDHSLTLAADEDALVRAPGGFTTGKVAPPVSTPADEADFFAHFRGHGYEIAHFFSHCSYDQNGFKLYVTTTYPLGVMDFHRHHAMFKANAFHFLNVCSGAPRPQTRGKSLVEFVDGQAAGGVIASLIDVRSSAAVDLAKAFYAQFLPKTPGETGPPASEALWAARERLAEDGRAAGYLYRAYGRPDAYLTPRAVRQAEKAQT